MGYILTWNVRALNCHNKWEDIKNFLHANKVGLVGLLETRVKLYNVDVTRGNLFQNWN